MKILKNKTYNQLLKTIEILITDKKKLSDKCDRIQNELNQSNDDRKYLIKENKEQDVFISSLNERVQKAETQYAKLKELFQRSITENSKLMSENLELESKLSRKGLGKKGLKKENIIVVEPQIDESKITKVEFEEYIDISEVNTLTDYIGYEFIAIDNNGNQTKGIICEDKTGSECIIAFIPTKSLGGWVVNDYDKTIPEKYHNNQFNARYIGVIGVLDWFNSFKIIKK